jgi:hypothetical protein
MMGAAAAVQLPRAKIGFSTTCRLGCWAGQTGLSCHPARLTCPHTHSQICYCVRFWADDSNEKYANMYPDKFKAAKGGLGLNFAAIKTMYSEWPLASH